MKPYNHVNTYYKSSVSNTGYSNMPGYSNIVHCMSTGVGKSSLAATLSMALANTGKKVNGIQ